MDTIFDEFIQLDRTFHELALKAGANDDVDLSRLLGHRDAIHWPQLLNEYRVILLSEAGSGKTEEIRNVARDLKKQGKHAFFVRIEHICHNFEDAFEEGTFDEFNAWVASDEEGWLLLDSVDEARLRDPRDFELAVKQVGRMLAPTLQRVHIVITSRTSAWRAKTDLMLCRTALPYRKAEKAPDREVPADMTHGSESKDTTARDNPAAPFLLVALDDLHGAQIDAFLRGKKVDDPGAFCDAVERKDALSLTTRPLDLVELNEFWKENLRIGSRLELMRSSISRRLAERDQNRSDARPITTEQLRLGARLVAAASTLGHESAIRVPDGADNKKGFSINEVLTDWNDTDCSTLLSRPIFDEGMYGTIRFHHGSVREYLTAEWLHELIKKHGSRPQVETLFFRSQYGIDVIVPTMRPVLSWLAILDGRILDRVCRLAPEVLFEGGDPSELPFHARRNILRQACEQLSQPAHGRSFTDFAALQRFSNSDLTDEINHLLAKYRDNDDIAWFLLRMVWHGKIVGAGDEVKRFAIESRAKSPRTAAFRALALVGSAADQEEVRTEFLTGKGDIGRDWLAELIHDLPYSDHAIGWLFQALARAPEKKRFEVDRLSGALSRLFFGWPPHVFPQLVARLHPMLGRPPVFERGNCDISKRHGWLAQHAARLVERLIEARDASVLEFPALAILRMLPVASAFGEHELRDVSGTLPKLVAEWPALSYALFWHDVAATRKSRELKGVHLTDHRAVGALGRYWKVDAGDFDTFCDDIFNQVLIDDKRVALSLAFAIYRESGRPAAWRRRLKRVTDGDSELASALHALLHPLANGRNEWRKQESRWKREAAARAALEKLNDKQWKEDLEARIDTLRDPGKPDFVTNDQHYLYHRLREDEGHSGKWSEGNWQSLIPEFGEPIARAFRDGAVRFWRSHRPQLLSEIARSGSTPFSVIFGLTGLVIEAREMQDWPHTLSQPEAELATRYALLELNGFPNWLPLLYDKHPTVVVDVVLNEIDCELAKETRDATNQAVLYDASWTGEWMWDRLAPMLLERLTTPPKNPGNLQHILTIVQGSSLDDATIARLASRKARSTRNLTTAPMWFAMWVGTAPAVAIPALAARLAEIKSTGDQTKFAMHFLVALVGGRREGGTARQSYRTVEHMKALYLLMHSYIREKEDLNRLGKGVYSPGLRDDAQDARNALLSYIRETRGKESFLALMEIAHAHPTETLRPWLAFQAKEKATIDADSAAWTPSQVREFHDQLERTPATHHDLWYLAVDRLLELKCDLEEGDSGIASILQPHEETEIRKYIGNWCREHAGGRYSVPQEEELADAKRPDLRFHGVGFDGPVPAELKLADKWTGPHLLERLEIQLCGDYLRDKRSSRGIFLLVYHGTKLSWELPNGKRAESFDALVDALQDHWLLLAPQFAGIEDIRVIGIDLTKRGKDAKSRSAAKVAN